MEPLRQICSEGKYMCIIKSERSTQHIYGYAKYKLPRQTKHTVDKVKSSIVDKDEAVRKKDEATKACLIKIPTP